MLDKILLFFLLSGFFVWYVQKQKIFDYIFVTKSLKELRECPVCLGFWVCLFFAHLLGVNILDFLQPDNFTYVIGLVLTAAISGFILHLIVAGWRTLYGVTIIN